MELRVKGSLHPMVVYGSLTVALLLSSVSILLVEHYYFHHEFLLHVAAIPLEILLGVLLVERLLHWHAKSKKKQQLMYIKSYFFRSEIRKVFLLNLQALMKPAISIERINTASLTELKEMRGELDELEYGEAAALEPVLDAYIESSQVFDRLMEWAIANDFEQIFHDMIDLLHFIQDVKLFKEQNPDKSFAMEACEHPELEAKMYEVLRDGVKKFLDYAIELKDKQPEVFAQLMRDYATFEAFQKLSARPADGKESRGECAPAS
ncbi:MAG: hypothetical protein ACK2UO_15620 [Caldilineaceae bacterium]